MAKAMQNFLNDNYILNVYFYMLPIIFFIFMKSIIG